MHNIKDLQGKGFKQTTNAKDVVMELFSAAICSLALDQIATLTRKISLGQKEVQLEPHEHEKFSRWLLF